MAHSLITTLHINSINNKASCGVVNTTINLLLVEHKLLSRVLQGCIILVLTEQERCSN